MGDVHTGTDGAQDISYTSYADMCCCDCRHDDCWRNHALQTLPVLIESSDMLVCGEDLGMIPSCVHPVMQELGLLGLRLQRMPSEQGQTFGDTSAYPYLTVGCLIVENLVDTVHAFVDLRT